MLSLPNRASLLLNLPLGAFGLLGIIWGANFIYMKMAVSLVTAEQVVLLRVVTGFIPVLLYAIWCDALKFIHLRFVGHFMVMSVLATVIYYYGFVKATEYLPSAIAGAASAAIPLFSYMFALLFLPEERFTRMKIIGLVTGFLGVVLIADPFAQFDELMSNMQGISYILVGSVCVGSSFVYAKKFLSPLQIPAAALTTYQLGFAILALCLVTDLSGIEHIASNTHVLLGTVLGLGVLGTGVAYLMYYYLVSALGAVRAASSTYLPPVVALIIGAVIVGEAISGLDYVGAGCILVGVYCLSVPAAKLPARMSMGNK